MIIVFKGDEVCFLSEKEEEILAYVESIGFDKFKWEKDMGMTMQEWLDNGHYIGDLTDFLPNNYRISTFSVGIDYRSGSPRFMRAFK